MMGSNAFQKKFGGMALAAGSQIAVHICSGAAV
jgi:hypothetical protein